MKFIENLKWRYATKKFDATKKVAQKDIDLIKEAIQLAASSYGLQSYKVLEIKNPELRQALKPLAWNQSQTTDASHLFVFCNTIEVKASDVDELMQLKASVNKIPLEQISPYGDFVKTKLKEKSVDEMQHWTSKQTYIALANAMNACAELKIDSTPMEGFESDAVNKKLQLNEKGLNASVMLAIGYRHKEDAAQHANKTRKALESIFESI